MIKRIIGFEIPLYIVVVILIVCGVGIFLFGTFYESAYSHNFKIPRDAFGDIDALQYGAWPALSDPNFFGTVKKEFLDQKASFIDANLETMTLRVYEEGVLKKEVPILAKGKKGTWWETPAGLYQVRLKKKNHFSSFGQVYQPWSMQFQGNYFIHGWPYYEGGEEVNSSYSGGCIRLATGDAEAIYDLVKTGMPVLVFDKGLEGDQIVYDRKAPSLSAASYLVADLQSNFVFLEKEKNAALPIASITKLITALVAGDHMNMDDYVFTVPKQSIVSTTFPRLRAGEEYSGFNLLYPMLVESSNEAAFTIADNFGRARFVDLMNEKAKALGMRATQFEDPAGMKPGNISTVEDIFTLAKNIYFNRSFILRMTAEKYETGFRRPVFLGLRSVNGFSGNPEFVGGKMGKSDAAKETIISLFSIDFEGQKRIIAVIVLGSNDAIADATALLQYVKSGYIPHAP